MSGTFSRRESAQSRQGPPPQDAGMASAGPKTVRTELILNSILVIRGQKVLLDADLASLYGIRTKAFNQAIKRNAARVPPDFMFRLTTEETDALNRSQFVTGSQKHRNPLIPPLAFTEHGTIMAATVLKSPQAIETSVYVVRAFVQLRQVLASNKDLAQRMARLETRVARGLARHDQEIAEIIALIRKLMEPAEPRRRSIGFTADIGKNSA
jgi:hypothetical protein